MRKHRSNSPRHAALLHKSKRGGVVAHCIARRAARRARMIMAIRVAYQRAAAHQARGYEMPLRGIFLANPEECYTA